MGAMQNPGALAGATGAYEASFAVDHHDTETGDAAQRLARATRLAGALRELVRAGARGVSTRDNPAPRWSAYVHRLRGEGVVVETEMEPHAGAYPGRHARYRLRSRVRIEGCAP